MTPQQIRAAIASSSELQAHQAAGNYEAIAASLTASQPTSAQRGVTVSTRGAAAAFPSIAGLPGALAFQLAHRRLASFAATAKASAVLPTNLLGDAIELQLQSFRDLGLDFGQPALRDMLDFISAQPGGITPDEAAAFKALAPQVAPAPVTWQAVLAAVQE